MKTYLFPCVAVVSLALVASSCGSGTTTGEGTGATEGTGSSSSGGAADKCVINATARALVEETVNEQLQAVYDVTQNAASLKRGYDVQIPGTKFSFVGAVTLAGGTDCPSAADVTRCQSTIMNPPPPSDPFWSTRDACFHFYCEGGQSKVGLLDTYMTMKPNMDATKRHKFTYDTTNPDGAAIYDPNPFITWRVDLTDLNAVKVTADLAANVKITPKDGALLDFSHKGKLAADQANGAVKSATADIDFTGLYLAGDPAITASAALDDVGMRTGTVKDGDKVIANIMTGSFEWLGDCAPTP